MKDYHYLTVEQLKNEFPDAFVLLLNPDFDKDFELVGGYFVATDKREKNLFAKVKDIDAEYKAIKTFYTGKVVIPDNVIICL